MQPDVICMGEPLMEFSQIAAADGSAHYLPGFGGDTSNCAIAAARQGVKVGYLTAIGADAFGDDLLELWQRELVDTSRVKRDTQAHTGIYFITYSAKGHSFTYLRAGSAASRITPDDLDPDYIGGARYLHVSGISQAISTSACDTVFHAIAVARARNVKVSYDTNLRLKLWPLERARAVIHAGIAQSDVALPSLDDSRTLTGLDDADAIADFYLNLGPKIVALKLGSEGALVATPDKRQRIAPNPVQVVDATGAGDTFGGAFLAQLSQGQDAFAAARYANAAAALSTRGHGAVAPIPHHAAVMGFLAGGAP